MKQDAIDKLTTLYRSEHAPWAALLLSRLACAWIESLPSAQRAPFQALHEVLSNWWPSRTPPLAEIYWRELAACWQAYERAPDQDESLLNTLQRLLVSAYLQLIVLQRFEKKLEPKRALLPNDLNEYSSRDFINTVTAACERLTPAARAAIDQWIDGINAAPPEEWEATARRLDLAAGQ